MDDVTAIRQQRADDKSLGRVFYFDPKVDRDLIRTVVEEDAEVTLRQRGLDWPVTVVFNPEPLDPFMAKMLGVQPGSIHMGWKAVKPDAES